MLIAIFISCINLQKSLYSAEEEKEKIISHSTNLSYFNIIFTRKITCINLHFHPHNDITFPFANLPRDYDIFREQPFLIVSTDETGIPWRPGVLFSVCHEYVRVFVFIRRLRDLSRGSRTRIGTSQSIRDTTQLTRYVPQTISRKCVSLPLSLSFSLLHYYLFILHYLYTFFFKLERLFGI